jgi:hemerythrin-like domain-containing protein
MESILDRGIKEVIDGHPAVAGILDEYKIGCAPCNVGTCQLKDIVEIHGLAPDVEAELLTRIARAIDPDAPAIEPTARKSPQGDGEIRYSPPMQLLVDEHKLIKRWLACIPSVAASVDLDAEADRELIHDGINFIRNYADRFHHAKEEDILFGLFDADLEIIRVMLIDHDHGRGFVKAAVAALDARDRDELVKQLTAYHELLTEHIQKEDEILYTWMDRNLTTSQVGQLYSRFAEVSREHGDVASTSEQFVLRAELRFQNEEQSNE